MRTKKLKGDSNNNTEQSMTENSGNRRPTRQAAPKPSRNARNQSSGSSLSPDVEAAVHAALGASSSTAYGINPDLIGAASQQYEAGGWATGGQQSQRAQAAGEDHGGPMDMSPANGGGGGLADMNYPFNTSSTSLNDASGYHNFPANPSDHSEPTTPNAGGESGGPTNAASKRREANRLAAARFRTRKKDQVAELESKVAGLEAENIGLRAEIQALRLVAASRESGGEVPSYTTLLEAQMSEQSQAAAVAAAVAAEAQAAAQQTAAAASSAVKRKRKTPSGEGVAGAESSAASGKRGFSMTSTDESRRGDNDVEEENGRLKADVARYETTLEAMHRQIDELRYKMEQQQGGYGRMDEGGYAGGRDGFGQNAKAAGVQDGNTGASTVPPLQTQYPQAGGSGYEGGHLQLPGRGSREGSIALSIPALSPALRISSPGTTGVGTSVPARSGSPLVSSSSPANAATASRGRNWQLNLSGLGSDIGRGGVIRTRGMDSPVSAERSGARGDDDDDGEESSGARVRSGEEPSNYFEIPREGENVDGKKEGS